MNAIQTDSIFTPEEQDALRANCNEIMKTEGLSQAAVAEDSTVGYSTLNQWLAGKYKGDNDSVASKIQTWLSSRAEKTRVASQVKRAPEFVLTKTAANFTNMIRAAHVMKRVLAIVGNPGIGKTKTLEHYACTNPNVWHITVQTIGSSVNALLQELAIVTGVNERLATRLPQAICRKIGPLKGCILIDEAQKLSLPALDQARDLNDACGVGLVLAGNEEMVSRLDGKSQFAQLASRVGMRIKQIKPHGDDICALIKAWDIEADDQIRFLKAIAEKSGALRSMCMAIEYGYVLAAGEGVPLALKHLRTAYAMSSVGFKF